MLHFETQAWICHLAWALVVTVWAKEFNSDCFIWIKKKILVLKKHWNCAVSQYITRIVTGDSFLCNSNREHGKAKFIVGTVHLQLNIGDAGFETCCKGGVKASPSPSQLAGAAQQGGMWLSAQTLPQYPQHPPHSTPSLPETQNSAGLWVVSSL